MSVPGGHLRVRGRASLNVRLEKETVWLTQAQMAKLFQRDQSVVARHLRNVFREKELDEKRTMQKMHIASSDRPVAFYNLDANISVGNRLNSKRDTQFRIWATRLLKEHLDAGYTANEHRLKELRRSLWLVQSVIHRVDVTSEEARTLLSVLTDYAYALGLLDDFDHPRVGAGRERERRHLARFSGRRHAEFPWPGSIPEPRGQSCPPSLLPREEPLLCGWEKAHCDSALPLVS